MNILDVICVSPNMRAWHMNKQENFLAQRKVIMIHSTCSILDNSEVSNYQKYETKKSTHVL